MVRRAAVLFALGLAIAAIPTSWPPDKPAVKNDKGEVVKEATRIEKNGIMHWPTYRIPGVLQRIAVCYLVVGLIALAGSWPLELLVAIGVMLAATLTVPAGGDPSRG